MGCVARILSGGETRGPNLDPSRHPQSDNRLHPPDRNSAAVRRHRILSGVTGASTATTVFGQRSFRSRTGRVADRHHVESVPASDLGSLRKVVFVGCFPVIPIAVY